MTLGKGDIAFICSLNGSFFANYRELASRILQSGATVVALTQNRNAILVNRADHVLLCGNSNQNDVGKYAALLTIDYLVLSYMRRIYADEVTEEETL